MRWYSYVEPGRHEIARECAGSAERSVKSGRDMTHCKPIANRRSPLCLEPADSIRRLGFARWYERRLIEGHAWFISGFICITAIAACVEELSFRGSFLRLVFYVAIVAAAAAIGIYGLVRYQKILVEAEQLGEHATCGTCGAYARFSLISSSQVRCRKCSHEWCLIQPVAPE